MRNAQLARNCGGFRCDNSPIEMCRLPDAQSNGEFEGLATRTIGNDNWDYWGDWLVLWHSTVEAAPVPLAFVMWVLRI